jgi:chromosome segregation ATPase
MAEQAKVTSLDALERFRSALIVFLADAHRSVDEVGDAIRQTRQWIQHDQRMHWEAQRRRWQQKLDQATQELMSARLSALRDSTTMQENAVRKAKAALTEAEEKLRALKHWSRNYDNAVDPLAKGLESLRYLLDHEMPKGVSYLLQAQKTLESYAERGTPGSEPAPEIQADETSKETPNTQHPPPNIE